MEGLSEWVRALVCFLIFFQALLQLVPGEKYRRYLKLFGDFYLVLLVVRPLAGLAGRGGELEDSFRRESWSAAYEELQGQMEGAEELRSELVNRAFSRELKRQLQAVPEAHGLSVLRLDVGQGPDGGLESVSLRLLAEPGEETVQEQVRRELSVIYGLSEERISIDCVTAKNRRDEG